MKRKSAVAFLLSVLLVALPACGGNGIVPGNATAPPRELQSPQEEKKPAARAVAAGANDFAFRLSAALAENAGDENFVCSPYSVWLPLAALANAANEQSKAALLSALGAAGMAETDTNEAASRMLYDLTKAENKEGEESESPLKIVNAVFVDDDVTLQKDFAQTFMDYYRGTAINVDFSSPDAADAVNRWASESTDGLITNLIQRFEPETVAAMANAMYFSPRWAKEFSEEQTAEDRFHAPAGDTTALYMRRAGALTYYEDDKVQAVSLGFVNSGGMYIILPKTGTAVELLSSMTNAYFSEIQWNAASAAGTLLLPRFSIESDVKGLKETLEQVGIPLFDEEAAPLTGGLIEEDRPVWLSDAVHKAVIHVDEKGATAAAVTVIAGEASGAMPQPSEPPFEMNCNKPFVFVLYDRTHDGGEQVLFTGIVNQP